jgi:hypothetical protein
MRWLQLLQRHRALQRVLMSAAIAGPASTAANATVPRRRFFITAPLRSRATMGHVARTTPRHGGQNPRPSCVRPGQEGSGDSWRPGVHVIAKQFGVDPGMVQRISRQGGASAV